MIPYALIGITVVLAVAVIALVNRRLLRKYHQEAHDAVVELRASEARLRTIGDNLPGALVYRLERDRHGTPRFHYLSAGITRLTGHTAAEVLADPSLFFDRAVPEDRPAAEAARIEAAATVSPLTIHFRLRDAAGRIRWIESSSSAPRPLPDGATLWDGIAIDVTERQEQEASRREQEALFRAAFENATAGIALVGTDGRFLRVNAALSDLLQYTAKELAGLRFQDVTHPDDVASGNEFIAHALAGGPPTGRFDKRYLRHDGQVVVAHVSTTLIDLPGNGRYFLTHIQDITERQRALRSLAANEALLRQFVRHTPAAVAMFDREMRYMEVSDRWLSDYSLGDQEVVGRSHYEVFPDIPERWKAVHQRALAGAVERCDDDPFPRADGRVDWLQWEVRPWLDTDGVIGGVIMFTQVMTERKRTELRVHHLNRVYAVLSSINEMIVREKDPGRVLDAACRIAVEKGRFEMAWVGRPNAAGSRLEPVASAGATEGYLDDVDIDLTSPERSNGPSGRCFREGVPVICNDLETRPPIRPVARRGDPGRVSLLRCVPTPEPVRDRGHDRLLLGRA